MIAVLEYASAKHLNFGRVSKSLDDDDFVLIFRLKPDARCIVSYTSRVERERDNENE